MRNQYGYGPVCNLTGSRMKKYIAQNVGPGGTATTMAELLNQFEAWISANGSAGEKLAISALKARYSTMFSTSSGFTTAVTSLLAAATAVESIMSGWSTLLSGYPSEAPLAAVPRASAGDFAADASLINTWFSALLSPGVGNVHIGTGDTAATRTCAVTP